MYPESDLVPLSALQHYIFCPRQCALIHVEQVWAENRLTAEGRLQHERVDEAGWEKRRDVKRVFGLLIRSLRLGLSGKADVVEFYKQAGGVWAPYPVEHKRGRPKKDASDEVQVCAQALCLEEMLEVTIPEAALFYGSQKRRHVVQLDQQLRQRTEDTARAVHELLDSGQTPPASYAKKCDNCSLLAICLPKKTGRCRPGTVQRYLAGMREAP